MISFQPFSGSQNTSGRDCSQPVELRPKPPDFAPSAAAAIAATRSASRRSTARSPGVIDKSSGVKPVVIFPAAVWSRPVDGPLP